MIQSINILFFFSLEVKCKVVLVITQLVFQLVEAQEDIDEGRQDVARWKRKAHQAQSEMQELKGTIGPIEIVQIL